MGSSSEYLIESEAGFVNGCYERMQQNNKNDYHFASTYPIYRKKSDQKLFLMLENANNARWIISKDLEGKDVKLRKT